LFTELIFVHRSDICQQNWYLSTELTFRCKTNLPWQSCLIQVHSERLNNWPVPTNSFLPPTHRSSSSSLIPIFTNEQCSRQIISSMCTHFWFISFGSYVLTTISSLSINITITTVLCILSHHNLINVYKHWHKNSIVNSIRLLVQILLQCFICQGAVEV